VPNLHLAPDPAPPEPAPREPSIMRRPHVTIRGLSKAFNGKTVYDKFDLDIPRGKFISIFGPNGCGKSTLIGLISGLIPSDAGQVLFDGMTIDEVRIGYVFQNYREALFPWLTARKNIEYPLKFLRFNARDRRDKVNALIERLNIRLDLDRYPYEMSGGQQQLVSILRALVIEPEVLMLDEPFSALDYEMTLFLREQLSKYFETTGTTTLIVSHDLEESVYLADKVLLLTRAPTAVADFVTVGSARPRGVETLRDPHFVEVKAHCLDVFQREVRR
jgi:NitT/TauT family transport system ATP-binding protein